MSAGLHCCPGRVKVENSTKPKHLDTPFSSSMMLTRRQPSTPTRAKAFCTSCTLVHRGKYATSNVLLGFPDADIALWKNRLRPWQLPLMQLASSLVGRGCATAIALPSAGGIGGAAVALALEQTPSIDDKILLLQPTPLLPEGLELAMRAHHGTCEGFGGIIFNGASGSNVEV